jgi:sirohydrochlorin ferrochelatase
MEWTEWTEWTAEEVGRAYGESTPALRAALDDLAERPDREVSSLELARAVYPHDDSDVGAERRLYGMLSAFGRRSFGYGKKEWFFTVHRKRRPDGSLVLGSFGYVMPAEKAAWLRKTSGRK